jgi:hypothetical protein
MFSGWRLREALLFSGVVDRKLLWEVEDYNCGWERYLSRERAEASQAAFLTR